MIADLKNSEEVSAFMAFCSDSISNKDIIEYKKRRRTRSIRQNSSLHLYFTMISEQLNELGLQFQYEGLKGMTLEMRYTPELVKNFIWRPIQVAMFEIESTTDINTLQINEIIDVITSFFGERGVVIEFPSIDSLLNSEEK